nr:sugar transferase [Eubacterium sp.]
MIQKGLYRTYIKRLLDIMLSVLALIVLSPVLLIVAILVRIKLGSPVVFKQPRPGKDEKIFQLYKFRSMTNELGKDGRLLPDSQRLTKFGSFLRTSSLDELMELINIIKGDMSIVGPRPLSIFYLPHYPSELRHRHDVRPGLTGLAQVHGRNNLQWDDRFAMDIQYVERVSFGLDIKIVLDTVLKVLKHSDVAVRGANQVKDYGPYCVLKEEGAGGRLVDGMTYSEIGSYFWLENVVEEKNSNKSWLPKVADYSFTFSGRNAIDVAVRDILADHK